jgi:cyanate lyase
MMGPRRPPRQTPPKYAEDERILAEHRLTPRGRVPAQGVPEALAHRFYENLFVYGASLKDVIQEKCGDDIMCTMDFTP